MRKRKRARTSLPVPRKRLPGFLGAVLAAVFLTAAFAHGAAAGPEDRRMGTRSGQAEITRDPATGDLSIATPDPAPEDRDQGPRTVIVSPEVVLDRPFSRPPGGQFGTGAGTGQGSRP